MKIHGPVTKPVTLDDLTYEVTHYYTPFRPGRYSGPPELCFEDEPAELEVTEVRRQGAVVTDETVLDKVYAQLEQYYTELEDERYYNDTV